MNNKNLDKLITEALAIEAEEAKEAGALGYMARSLVQATMPHKQTKGNEFVRKNGAFTLSMMSPSEIGLPYGTIPRLLVSWLTTEAVRTKEPTLLLGDTLSGFMSEIGLVPTGGRWGSITRLKQQTTRLFSSFISCSYSSDELSAGRNISMVDEYELWWTPKNPNQLHVFDSKVTLNKRFFDEITTNPVPIDMRALKALKRSPMALDIYCWLTYRLFYLRKPTVIPWAALEVQFGADYARTRAFKEAFLTQLRKVSVVYPEARVEDTELGLMLKPSSSHIASAPRLITE